MIIVERFAHLIYSEIEILKKMRDEDEDEGRRGRADRQTEHRPWPSYRTS